MTKTETNTSNDGNQKRTFLERVGYVDFLSQVGGGALGNKHNTRANRRLTVALLLLMTVLSGFMVGRLALLNTLSPGSHAFEFIFVIAVGFLMLTMEMAMVVQIRKAVYEPFDERMQQMNDKARAHAYRFVVGAMVVAMVAAAIMLVLMLNWHMAISIYFGICMTLLLQTHYAPLFLLSWQLPDDVKDDNEDDEVGE
jgi:hypothetical protein